VKSWLGPSLVAAALVLHFLVGRPAAEEAGRAQAESLRLQSEKAGLAARRAQAEEDREGRQLAERAGQDVGRSSEDVAHLRRALLEPMAGQALTGVRLAVTPGAPPRAAEARLRVEGRYRDLLALAGQLARPGNGLVLRRVQLTPVGSGLALEAETFTVARGWPTGTAAVPGPPPVFPVRDPFRRGEENAPRPVAAASKLRAEAPATPPPPPPATPLLLLVGFVRRPDGVRAAVATPSGVVIVGPGDRVLGHAVVKVDEDGGLRLRDPDGGELTLFPTP